MHPRKAKLSMIFFLFSVCKIRQVTDCDYIVSHLPAVLNMIRCHFTVRMAQAALMKLMVTSK